jgi:glycine/D-amino acid oxidase-like deaminating enzyme
VTERPRSGGSARARSARASWADAEPMPYWLDRADRPPPRPPLTGELNCDLLVVGGGYSGLWIALLAKQRDPDRDVVLVEAGRIGWAASGRNGGFCVASLTHGEANGRARFPAEYDRLRVLGAENLDQIEQAVQEFGIDCDFRRTGGLDVATEPYQVRALYESDGEFLDAGGVRAQLNSPTFLAGSWDRHGTALVDPARLAWGLAAACERAGVRIFEGSQISALARAGPAINAAVVRQGTIVARHVALATNAFPPLLRSLRLFTVPVYDYVLMSEPLSQTQRASIGWLNEQGVGDSGNQFHYYRLTADNRILWGGYDAIYHFGGRIHSRFDQRPATFDVLARHFFETFPQLEGLRFSHRWGGAIDTCTRFCAFYGTALRGQLAYCLGYTGLGVAATRFAAQVVLDLLGGEGSERTRLELVRRRPLPFPPEPLAFIGIEITRRCLARADANAGRRNLWLRTLDRAGLGFDS